jgi:hypothetical protein
VIPILIALIAFALPLAAEPVAIEITVIDRDLDIPLEGVQVQEATTGVSGFTGADGSLTLDADLPAPRAVLLLSLIGYEPVRTLVTEFDQTTEIGMVLEGVLQAEELVIEADAIGTSDDEVGISVVVERDLLKSTAMIGPIEDVMSTIKMLPGVTYNGSFNSYLSVRGGEPGSLTHVMDGFVVQYPYHWGGGVSIFNPHLVDTVKLSAGIFPVRYGQATSGLMEVTTTKPVDGTRWTYAQSTSTLEGYVQAPIGESSGVFVGTRLTNYDLVFLMTGQFLEDTGVTFSRVPYIYDGYFKFYTRPRPSTEIAFNAFAGTDGIGLEAIDPDADTETEILDTFDFRWINRDVFGNVTLSRLVGDRLLIDAVAGYEYWSSTVDAAFFERGTRAYSDEFIAAFPGLVSPGDTFSVNARSDFENTNVLHHTQARVDGEYQLTDRHYLGAGTGAFYSLYQYDATGSLWTIDFDESGMPEYRRVEIESAAPDNRTLTSFGYASLASTLVPDRLESEIGIRVDHSVLFGKGFTVNTFPVLGPRAILHYTRGDSVWSLGTGVFSRMPFESIELTEEMGVRSFDVSVPKSFLTVLGWERDLGRGYRFTIEGYYKYLYDRFYINEETVSQDEIEREISIRVRNNGIGHVGGFDILLDRRTSRYLDGMISYSFIYARYLNPTEDDSGDAATDPRGRWYYPSFHRFHNLNVVLNIKPTDWMTITPMVTFATGTPTPRFGDKEVFAATIEDAETGEITVAEMYARDEFYDDDRREGWVMPIDLRIAFHGYGRGGKVYREAYIGAEDILAPLWNEIAPSSNAVTTDRYTGEDTRDADQGFSFPIISVGFRLSY